MPSTSAIDSETKPSLLVPYLLIAWSSLSPLPATSPLALVWAAPMRSDRLKPNFVSTQKNRMPAPMISRTALIIWTQVVPFMPPMSTYAIISRPTTAMTAICATSAVMPSRSATSVPAPAIWARR